MCRKDLTEWAQSVPSARALVHADLWKHIQRQFPDEIRNRTENKTREIIAESIKNYNLHGIKDDVYRSCVLSSRIPNSPQPAASTVSQTASVQQQQQQAVPVANNRNSRTLATTTLPSPIVATSRSSTAVASNTATVVSSSTISRPGEIGNEFRDLLRAQEAKRMEEELLSMALINEILRQEAEAVRHNYANGPVFGQAPAAVIRPVALPVPVTVTRPVVQPPAAVAVTRPVVVPPVPVAVTTG
jgi:hypothetical protein